MKESADALSAAHAVSVVHRDIKPDNILLEGTRGRVMVTDFGIAKALSQGSGATLTGAGVAIGTPAFMSPEQAAGEKEIDGRSDLYSLGIVTYQMLTGELPFNAPTVAGILMKQITEPAPDIRARSAPTCPRTWRWRWPAASRRIRRTAGPRRTRCGARSRAAPSRATGPPARRGGPVRRAIAPPVSVRRPPRRAGR